MSGRFVLTCVAFALFAHPAHARDRAHEDCAQSHDLDRSIAGCTETLARGKREPAQNRVAAYIGRGNAYAGKREYDRAIADYNEAIRLNPKYPLAYVNRGNAYNRKGEYDRAIADFDKAIGLDPKLASAYGFRGGTYLDKGDPDRAIADLDKRIELALSPLDPKLAPAYGNRGWAYSEKGDLDRAIADLDKAIGLDPKLAPAYGFRGTAYAKKGDLDRAIADYKKALPCDEKVLICHVQNNTGGSSRAFQSIADYIYSKGMTMVVDGLCASACAGLAELLLLKDPRPGILPSVCVTANVDFRFHQRYHFKDPKGPEAEWNVVWETDTHMPAVQRWLDANGGSPETLRVKDYRRMPALGAMAIWPHCEIIGGKVVFRTP